MGHRVLEIGSTSNEDFRVKVALKRYVFTKRVPGLGDGRSLSE
jgi:hypothetical protein